jgi:undecaprenyl-diphosphatase
MHARKAVTVTITTVTFAVVFWMSANLACGQDAASSSPEPSRLSLFQALMLGFVEGATEYLPVSSTGHLLIVEHLLGMHADDSESDAAHSLAICIQCGAILAVVLLYFRRIVQMLQGLTGKNPEGQTLLINLIVAFIPAAIIGLLFSNWIKVHLFGVMPVALALLIGGVIIVLQALFSGRNDGATGKDLLQMTWKDALLVGILQCLAFWPGFSRSLATILGCRWVGLKMQAAVEFSFLLGLLTLSAATVYEGMKNGAALFAAFGLFMPLVSLVTAFFAAIVSVHFMVAALGRHGLLPFGIYRIALAVVCVLWLH